MDIKKSIILMPVVCHGGLQAQRKRQYTMSRERWMLLEKTGMEWN
jgi:hypothetical protein